MTSSTPPRLPCGPARPTARRHRLPREEGDKGCLRRQTAFCSRPTVSRRFREWGRKQDFGFLDTGWQLMAAWAGFVWSAVGGCDLAAEHYHPDKLVIERLNALGGTPIGRIASPVREIVTPSPDIPVFDLAAAQVHVLQRENAQTEERVSAKKKAKGRDVIVSRLRSYLRQVAVIPVGIDLVLLSTEFVVLRPKSQDDVGFLVPYILSEPIQSILAWSQDGNEHPRFNEQVLLSVLVIPRVLALRERLNRIVGDAAASLTNSAKCYTEAEVLLESALGLDKLDLTPKLSYQRRHADVQAAGRCDAEYFNPRLQNLIVALSHGGLTIANVAKLSKRRFRPKPGTQFHYIEIANVTGSGTAESSAVAGEEAPSRATWTVKPGDIITTTVRPIRRLSAIITDEQDGHVCTSGFAVLAPRNIAPELLLVYLRLPLVCELLDLYTTASMYPAIATDDLMKIPILLPAEATRETIIAKVRESFDARRDARQLLDQARAMVEEAILDESETLK